VRGAGWQGYTAFSTTCRVPEKRDSVKLLLERRDEQFRDSRRKTQLPALLLPTDYRTASGDYEKIEASEEPFVPNADPERYDQQPFLGEWFEAEKVWSYSSKSASRCCSGRSRSFSMEQFYNIATTPTTNRK